MSAVDTPVYDVLDSPVGQLLLVGDGRALTGLHMLSNGRPVPAGGDDWQRDPFPFAEAAGQLRAYFAGDLTEFEVTLERQGTDRKLTLVTDEQGNVTTPEGREQAREKARGKKT